MTKQTVNALRNKLVFAKSEDEKWTILLDYLDDLEYDLEKRIE